MSAFIKRRHLGLTNLGIKKIHNIEVKSPMKYKNGIKATYKSDTHIRSNSTNQFLISGESVIRVDVPLHTSSFEQEIFSPSSSVGRHRYLGSMNIRGRLNRTKQLLVINRNPIMTKIS